MVRSAMEPEYDGGSCGTKYRLEDSVAIGRQSTEIIGSADQRIESSDDRTGAGKHNAEANQPVDGGSDTEVHQVFHNNVSGVFCPGHTCFAESKASLHEENHGSAKKCPYDINRLIHNKFLPFHSYSFRTAVKMSKKRRCAHVHNVFVMDRSIR